MMIFYSTLQLHFFLWAGNFLALGLIYLLQLKLYFPSLLNFKTPTNLEKTTPLTPVLKKLLLVAFVFMFLNYFFYRGGEFNSLVGNLELTQHGVSWVFWTFFISFFLAFVLFHSNLPFTRKKEGVDFFFWVFFISYMWSLVPFVNNVPTFLLMLEFLTFILIGFLSWTFNLANSGLTLFSNFKTPGFGMLGSGIRVLVFFLWSSAFSTLFFFWALGLLGPEIGFLDRGLSVFLFTSLNNNLGFFSFSNLLGVFLSLAVLLKLMISPFHFFLLSFYEALPPLAWVFYLSFYYTFFLLHASMFLFFFIPFFFKSFLYLFSSLSLVLAFIFWGSFKFSLDVRIFFALSTLAYFSLILLSLTIII